MKEGRKRKGKKEGQENGTQGWNTDFGWGLPCTNALGQRNGSKTTSAFHKEGAILQGFGRPRWH
jgi:hypothetical protein